MSALPADVSDCNGLVANKNQIWVTAVFGNSKPQRTAGVRCCLLGDTLPVEVNGVRLLAHKYSRIGFTERESMGRLEGKGVEVQSSHGFCKAFTTGACTSLF